MGTVPSRAGPGEIGWRWRRDVGRRRKRWIAARGDSPSSSRPSRAVSARGHSAARRRAALGALAGLRVFDLSRVLAGPWATQTLGDLGAEIIKIERPGRGDDTRAWGPPEIEGAGYSAYFAGTNRNKRSVTIDMAMPAGQELVTALARVSDVLVENFKVGAAARFGLDYATLSRANPRLVYCSITGFGQSGPYASPGRLRRNDPGHGRPDEHHRPARHAWLAAARRRSAWRSSISRPGCTPRSPSWRRCSSVSGQNWGNTLTWPCSMSPRPCLPIKA